MKHLYILIIGIGLFFSCNRAPSTDILKDNIDNSISPGEDFFLYANGSWLKKNPVPGSESSWGIGNLVEEEIYNRLKKINEKSVKANSSNGSIEQKIGDFWESAMDTITLNKVGLAALKDELSAINALSDIPELLSVVAGLQMKGVSCLFDNYITQDDMNSEMMAFRLDQGGLGLPNRDYYFNTDERTEKVRSAYKKYLSATFKQVVSEDIKAQKMAKEVYALEEKLARSSRTLEDLRDPYKNYNKMSVRELNELTPNIDWSVYLKNIGVHKLDAVIIGQPEFYVTLSNELKATPLTVWRNYLIFHVIKSYAEFLDNTTYTNYFTYSQSLTGATEPRPRWKRVLDAEESAMGEALGQLFAKEYFNETAKKRYNDIVENVRTAYKERIERLSWMSDSTKQKAIAKLKTIKKKVGYPDKWKDFSKLNIERGPYVNNMQNAALWWHKYYVDKLGKPVDRDEWDMTPQTYNAYYNPSNNEIVLPAGIFAVPGYRDEDLDDGLVYGYAAASTIGHEITHGFDDWGRQYDENGNLSNWWTKKDEAEFTKRAEAIIRQFSEFIPVDTLHINGNVTQGENIADLGGLLIGLDAFKKTPFYKANKSISGYTPLQRYFLGYALGWMYNTKKERLAYLVKSDEHAPAKERVNGPFVNIPEFYEAFNIKPGDKMYRPDSLRVSIW